MRKALFVFLSITMLIVGGCASPAGKLNTAYVLKGPETADKKIAFDGKDNQVIAAYLNRARYANDLWLFWLTADNLYLNLEDSGIILIQPALKKMRWLEGDERKEAVKMISKKVSIMNDVSSESIYKKIASSVLSSLGQRYTGEVIDNGKQLKVVARVSEIRESREGQGITAGCSKSKLEATLVNTKGEAKEIEWEYNCDWMPQSVADTKVPQMLRKLQIAPSGKYYSDGKQLYRADRRNAGAEDILGNDNLSASMNPQWTKIAVLKNVGQQYWIEFYDISIEKR